MASSTSSVAAALRCDCDPAHASADALASIILSLRRCSMALQHLRRTSIGALTVAHATLPLAAGENGRFARRRGLQRPVSWHELPAGRFPRASLPGTLSAYFGPPCLHSLSGNWHRGFRLLCNSLAATEGGCRRLKRSRPSVAGGGVLGAGASGRPPGERRRALRHCLPGRRCGDAGGALIHSVKCLLL